MLKLTFHGAAQEVTGSMHLLEADGILVALDCGLFQGRREESSRKNREFPFDPKNLHALVLSHAHVDHCGRIPMLVKNGFRGRIYATPATRDLCALILRDSAHIQAEDAFYLNKKRERKGESPIEPFYDDDDAIAALRLFHAVSPRHPFWITRRLRAEFLMAGHMLGAAMIRLDYQHGGGGGAQGATSLLFSGDLGRFDTPLLKDPSPFPESDYLICESTYGGRRHPPTSDLREQLADVVNDTFRRGGKVVIPAFSVGRTQVIVYFLHQLVAERRIPDMPIYIDSPLAVNATEVFRLHPDLFDQEALAFQAQAGDILGGDCCTYVRDSEQSKAINRRRRPCIIISASGMCEAGRILHHLKNNVQNPRNTVLIVGFQAAHTLGRRIVEKQPEVRIFNQTYKLKAQVAALNGFSAHADSEELGRLYRPIANSCRGAFLVHGEPDQMKPLAAAMRDAGMPDVQMPMPADSFVLDADGR
ncbi:MAG: MBL fold metallo-hydrolase [Phycisphaerae bacterium]|nr:MBL fold metallo-hydrolase [Phycisphaerae bacterium]